jgi:hypothetical protein
MKILLLAISFAACAVFTPPCYSASYTVTTTNDSGPNSLRAIIITANGTAGPHTITFGNSGNFAGGGTINLATPLPVISNSVTITGWTNADGSNAVSVNGSALVFQPSSVNAINYLNIGGSLTNGQSLSLKACVVTHGGIWSTGILQMVSSSVISSPGVGVWNSGNATLNLANISFCNEGGIHNEGVMTVANSKIQSNVSINDGAGIYSLNSIQINLCQIVGNTAASGRGGGLYNSGTANIVFSEISANTALCFGGAIFNSGNLIASQSTLIGNTSIGGGGGNGGNSSWGGVVVEVGTVEG